MPATAAIDNETLDHLLSVTDLALATLDKPVLLMFTCLAQATVAGTLPGRARRRHIAPPPASHCRVPYSAMLGPSQMRQIRSAATKLARAACGSRRVVLSI